MYGIFVTIIVIASILITFAVLLQNSKGGGLAANFAAGNTTFGVRQTADILEKATWILAAIIIGCCVLATVAISGRKAGSKSVVPEATQKAAKSVVNTSIPAIPMDEALSQEAEQQESTNE